MDACKQSSRLLGAVVPLGSVTSDNSRQPPPGGSIGQAQRDHRKLFSWRIVVLALAAFAVTVISSAQDEAAALSARSSVIVRGKVLKTNASEEPLVEPSNQTAVISVEEMYAGKEIAGDQRGRKATVILNRPESVKVGEEAVFFGNARFLGASMTIADEGELPPSSAGVRGPALQEGVNAQKDAPIRNRLAAAALVFRGTVENIHPLEAKEEQGKRPSAPSSEHDPEWQVATVRVTTALRGGEPGRAVTLLFAASRDITWFNSPKLKPGQDAIFLPRAPKKEEEEMYRSSALAKLMETQTVYLVTEPYDVLPPAQEARVRAMLSSQKEGRQ